jgi:hypothetical protein
MIPNAKPQVKRPEPMTPEQAAEWDKRKLEQYDRIVAGEAEAMTRSNISLSMVQTKHTFSINAAWQDFATSEEFRDELVFGDPAKAVPRDDKVFVLKAVDLTDDQIKAAFREWRLRRKLPPPPSRVV